MAGSLRIVGIMLVCPTFAGCGDAQHIAPPPIDAGIASASLIGDSSRFHHFGAVISEPGRKLEYSYQLRNKTRHAIKIVEVVNRKPCCGEIGIGKTTLEPEEETGIRVALSVNQEFGDIIHETVILTDPPQREEIVLRTMAKAFPPIRFEEVASENASALLTSDRPTRVELNVFAYGTPSQPAADLDHLMPVSTLKTTWGGPTEQGHDDGDLIVASRSLAVWVDPSDVAGAHSAEVQLKGRGGVVYRYVLNWETVGAIAASPKMAVVQTGKGNCRVVLRSNVQRKFRVVRAECDIPGVQVRVGNSASALQQVVEVTVSRTARSNLKGGVIAVFTDDPGQMKVDLPLAILE
jgi:hypothetical protein